MKALKASVLLLAMLLALSLAACDEVGPTAPPPPPWESCEIGDERPECQKPDGDNHLDGGDGNSGDSD